MKSSHFCGLKRFLSYLEPVEHQETLFSSFFKSKNKQRKILKFLTQVAKIASVGLLKSSNFVV